METINQRTESIVSKVNVSGIVNRVIGDTFDKKTVVVSGGFWKNFIYNFKRSYRRARNKH